MPIYEYQCQDCEEVVEILQKISDAPAVECPSCGQSSLKKKVSAAAFRLKGSGWYETDFKTGAKKNIAGDASAKSSASSSDKPPAASSSNSGESKTA